MALAGFRMVHRLRVRWVEVDMQRVVFNGHYLTYFDIALTEYWRTISAGDAARMAPYLENVFAVKSVVEYKAPARYDDELDIAIRVGRIGRTSMQFLLEIHRAADHLVSGELTYVYVDPASARPAPVPDGLRAMIEKFEGGGTPGRKW